MVRFCSHSALHRVGKIKLQRAADHVPVSNGSLTPVAVTATVEAVPSQTPQPVWTFVSRAWILGLLMPPTFPGGV